MSKQQSNILSKILIDKKNILETARITLKKEFVGIDSIIDEIIHSIEAWFIYSEGQIRPAIVNLWGLTGVGKTSLIVRLSELIGLNEKLFRFDVGDYSSENSVLKDDFSEKLKSSSSQPIIIVFDEFQLGRTVSSEGKEIDRSGLRALWDLLDSGKLSILNDTYYGSKVITLILKLQHCVDSGVESSKGKITKNIKIHSEIFYKKKGKAKLTNEDNEQVDASLFIPEEFYYYIKHMIIGFHVETESSLKRKMLSMNHLEVLRFLNELITKNLKPTIHDFSQALIFIVGNLDEVYSMANNVNPDSDADLFHEHSLKISITEVKEALQQRFRVEQIARLGNNHILYPAFSSKSYYNLIALELEKFKQRMSERYHIFIELDNSINDIIYKEGVFPTQGTRPIFTTINNLVESYISKIMSDIIINDLTPQKISWKFVPENSEYEVAIHVNKKTIIKKYPLNLKINNLRESTKDDFQANIAVHEAGHAVLCAMYLRLIPEEVISQTAGTVHGYCRIKYPRILTSVVLERDIVVGLGGYVAELLVFGKSLLSNGSSRDIEMVTEKAISYIKTYGMNGFPALIGVPSQNMNQTHFFKHEDSDKQVKELIDNSLKTAKKIMKKNKTLLLKVAEFLSENTKMNKELMTEYVQKYGVDIPEIRTANTYHSFKEILNNKIHTIKK